jgi:hypothetical protein
MQPVKATITAILYASCGPGPTSNRATLSSYPEASAALHDGIGLAGESFASALPQMLEGFLQRRDFAQPCPVAGLGEPVFCVAGHLSSIRGSWAGSTRRNRHRLQACSWTQGVP